MCPLSSIFPMMFSCKEVHIGIVQSLGQEGTVGEERIQLFQNSPFSSSVGSRPRPRPWPALLALLWASTGTLERTNRPSRTGFSGNIRPGPRNDTNIAQEISSNFSRFMNRHGGILVCSAPGRDISHLLTFYLYNYLTFRM